MGRKRVKRRSVLAGISACALLPRHALTKDYMDLNWSDLVPEGETIMPPMLQGLIDHNESNVMSRQPASSGVRTEWNGQIVRLPGFIVPIDYSGAGVTAFILVPFVGACVHVPPPPANQLVFVTTPEPFESTGLFEAIHVVGMFGTTSMTTRLADIGYTLTAHHIEPLRAK